MLQQKVLLYWKELFVAKHQETQTLFLVRAHVQRFQSQRFFRFTKERR